MNSKSISNSSIILLLNHYARFKDKINSVPLQNWFPDYEGGNDVGKALAFVTEQYSKLNRCGRKVYIYPVDPEDEEILQLVYQTVMDTIRSNKPPWSMIDAWERLKRGVTFDWQKKG